MSIIKIDVKKVVRETKSSKLKEKAKKFFQDTKSINCPAFANEKIFFNAKGLQHLFYYSVIPAWRKRRFGVLNSKTKLWKN